MKRVLSISVLFSAVAGSALASDFGLGNLVVSQVGDGSSALGSSATAVFLREFTTGGVSVQTIAIPTSISGSNRRFTNSGSATSEGTLTRSANGSVLTLGGYDAVIGTASIASTTSASTNRVVAFVDNSGTVDTGTALDAFSGSNIRSAVSLDGTSAWLGGTSSTSGGIQYALRGGSANQVSGLPSNTRVTNIFDGQLYVSSASGSNIGINIVGSGTPTTGGQTTTLLPGFSAVSGLSPYDFFFADPSTLYVADDGGLSSNGGLQKWTFNGSTWSLAYRMTNQLSAGLRGLTGTLDGTGGVTLYAITADATSNKLVSINDSITSTSNSSSFTTIATAGANTAFRGVDFAPAPVPEPATLAALGLGIAGLFRRVKRS